jgi:hypothetical protein
MSDRVSSLDEASMRDSKQLLERHFHRYPSSGPPPQPSPAP